MSKLDGALKVGVVFCTCGGILKEVIDFDKLEDFTKELPDVDQVIIVNDLCKSPEKYLEPLKGSVNAIIIAGCSERSSLRFNEDRIKKLLQYLGIDLGMHEVVNLREQCAFIHQDKEATTGKAMDMIHMAYVKLQTNYLAYRGKELSRDVLVIGGGPAGLSCAQTLADLGVNVCLVEKKPYIGGHVPAIPLLWQGEGFPSVCTSECIAPVMGRNTILRDKIEIMVNSEVIGVSRIKGNFRVKIEQKPQRVNPEKCVGCGKCSEVCPVEVPNPFDLGMKNRKAIDKDFRLAIPDVYNIDEEACNKCGECVKVCPFDAIDLEAEPKVVEKEFGAVVIATGFDGYDMKQFEALGYGKYENVITMLEFERHWANRFKGRPPISIAFVLCQKDEVGYCSRLCCLATVKHAVRLSMAYLGTEVNVFYKSLRTCGRAFEEFKREAETRGIEFIQTEVKRIEEGEEGFLKVVTENGEYEAELVVLAEPLVPAGAKIAKLFGIVTDKFGFPIEFQPKLVTPLETYVERVFVAGTAKGFKDIQESIESGIAAAHKAYQSLHPKEQKYVSLTEHDRCSKCGLCAAVCPHNAISVKEDEVKIDPEFCKGCGLCYSTCPSKAVRLVNMEEFQIVKMIEVAFNHVPKDEPRILAFLCYWCAYGAGDLMGVYRNKLPENIRTLRVRCSGSISLELIWEILAKDLADGVLLAGCPPRNCHHLWGNYMQDKRFKLMNKVLRELNNGKKKIARWEYIGVTNWDRLTKVLKIMDNNLRSKS